MKGSLVTRFAVMVGILTLWSRTDASAATAAAATTGGSHAANANLHASDSKISRIQPHAAASAEGYALRSHQHLAHRHLPAHQHRGAHASVASSSKSPKSVDGRMLSNHEVLRSLGLAKLNIPSSHHRKRLAVESRHHSRPDDSHMYIIKLPPNPVYYTKTTGHERNAIGDTKKKLTVDFMSNGKPGRIYHWNLPVLKRMLSQEGGGGTDGGGISARTASNSRLSNDISELIDIRHIPTWTKPWENDTVEKTYRKNDRLSSDDSMLADIGSTAAFSRKKSPTYYAPRPKKSANVQQKYFPGNGKPKSFYVMKGKSQTPHYQKLIP